MAALLVNFTQNPWVATMCLKTVLCKVNTVLHLCYTDLHWTDFVSVIFFICVIFFVIKSSNAEFKCVLTFQSLNCFHCAVYFFFFCNNGIFEREF